jgi:hypothetical protein
MFMTFFLPGFCPLLDVYGLQKVPSLAIIIVSFSKDVQRADSLNATKKGQQNWSADPFQLMTSWQLPRPDFHWLADDSFKAHRRVASWHPAQKPHKEDRIIRA